ncbi:MAG: hypothetical protein ABI280_10520 [Ginsengibacter sp.]
MIIKEKQLEHFSQLKLEKFNTLTLDFIKNNCKSQVAGKDDEKLRIYILEMIRWAENYEIYSGLNVQKLLYHKTVFGWEIPLNKKLETYLKELQLHEDKRAENFCLNVASQRYKLIKITLESDLTASVIKKDF